ncbi:MAG: tRNA preQ1(34) S-adenosylmethionine ribosyltransferase-isomerase QueA, partial [Spirochaetales bacterium]|nr:tRNA preQ1(34) S-adenosylmethionine ribosyltransferase-isomerase QueA [Spirochaetales bacterium]
LKELSPGVWDVLPNKLKRQKPGKTYVFGNNIRGTIIEAEGTTRTLRFDTPVDEEFFEAFGHVPLPPYIRREDEQRDTARYQTIYSEQTGSAAAPTAGLHFTPGVLASLEDKGIEVVRITLHVGMGTFVPIRTENVEDHHMHEEEYDISPHAAHRIDRALKEKRKIIAVGTTSVRALESACQDGKIIPGKHSTSLFIYPGYTFKVTSGLLTNFHTPGSSLLVLVSAFAGIGFIRRAYASALEHNYRFFSYGDAMLIM